jgi:hypothetical protein
MANDALILETALGCLEQEFPPGPTWPPSLADAVNARLRAQGVSVAPEHLVHLLEPDPRVLVEYRDGGAVPWLRLRSSITAEDARARLVEILIEAQSFDELAESVALEYGADPHRIYGYALRFITEGKPNGLDDGLVETFGRALSRFSENHRAVELAGILHAHVDRRRR